MFLSNVQRRNNSPHRIFQKIEKVEIFLSQLTLEAQYWSGNNKARQKHCKESKLQASNLQEHRCKILTLIFAKRILQHSKSITYHDQMGLTPRLGDWFKIQKSLNVIHHINNINKNHNHFNKYIRTVWKISHPFLIKKKSALLTRN